jgi:hypothetical protein
MTRERAEEIFLRLTDRYTPTEIVEVLGLTNEDLEDIGLIDYIEDSDDGLVFILESLRLLK